MKNVLRRTRFLLGCMPRFPGADQKRVVEHARCRGIEEYQFTKREYSQLRRLAVKMHLKEELVAEFDKDFYFMHRCPRLMRIGRFNSITGMSYIIAVHNYAKIAKTIQKAALDFKVVPDE